MEEMTKEEMQRFLNREAEKGKQGDIFVNGDLNNKFQPYFREKV